MGLLFISDKGERYKERRLLNGNKNNNKKAFKSPRKGKR